MGAPASRASSMKVRGRTVPSRWQCSSTFGIDLKNSGVRLTETNYVLRTKSFAVFLRRGGERLVVLLALRGCGQDRLVGGDRLVEEALLLGLRQMDFLAAVLGPDLLRAL